MPGPALDARNVVCMWQERFQSNSGGGDRQASKQIGSIIPRGDKCYDERHSRAKG